MTPLQRVLHGRPATPGSRPHLVDQPTLLARLHDLLAASPAGKD